MAPHDYNKIIKKKKGVKFLQEFCPCDLRLVSGNLKRVEVVQFTPDMRATIQPINHRIIENLKIYFHKNI